MQHTSRCFTERSLLKHNTVLSLTGDAEESLDQAIYCPLPNVIHSSLLKMTTISRQMGNMIKNLEVLSEASKGRRKKQSCRIHFHLVLINACILAITRISTQSLLEFQTFRNKFCTYLLRNLLSSAVGLYV